MMTVSLCVVALNEENFLPRLLSDLENQTYPKEYTEIVLIDGGSTDRTKEIMSEFARKEGFLGIRVLDNPKKIQAAGWNVAIENAVGDVIIRIDAHTHIPPEFTAKNMALQEKGEYVTGGVRPCLIDNPTPWGDTLLEVENSLFGSSIGGNRKGHTVGYVKTMFHAAYRKEVFEKVGGFNEELLRTEDNEMHCRIRKAGYKLYSDSDIVSYQYARSNLRKMTKQKYANGRWIGLTLGVCPSCISIFHLVPFCFLLGIIATCVLSCFGLHILTAVMWSLYGVFAVGSTLLSIIKTGFSPYKILMPFLFLTLHLAYGVGTFVGLCQMPFLRKKLKNCDSVERVKNALSQR